MKAVFWFDVSFKDTYAEFFSALATDFKIVTHEKELCTSD